MVKEEPIDPLNMDLEEEAPIDLEVTASQLNQDVRMALFPSLNILADISLGIPSGLRSARIQTSRTPRSYNKAKICHGPVCLTTCTKTRRGVARCCHCVIDCPDAGWICKRDGAVDVADGEDNYQRCT